jgi:hypothetical protein
VHQKESVVDIEDNIRPPKELLQNSDMKLPHQAKGDGSRGNDADGPLQGPDPSHCTRHRRKSHHGRKSSHSDPQGETDQKE